MQDLGFSSYQFELGPEQPNLQAVNRLCHPASLMHWPRYSQGYTLWLFSFNKN